jgi:hypothetical protein
LELEKRGRTFSVEYSGRYFVNTRNGRVYVGSVGGTGNPVLTNAFGRDIFTTARGIMVVGNKRVARNEIPCFWLIETNVGGFSVTAETMLPDGYVMDVDASGRWFLCRTLSDLFPRLFVYDSLSRKKVCKMSNQKYCFFDIQVPIDVFKNKTITRTTAPAYGKQP